MLTRIALEIEKKSVMLNPDEVKNWDDIRCTYKRNDIDGIVRSFSSKFEFVGRAYDMLMTEYLSKGFSAKASITVQVIDNNWRWHDAFTSQLDFSTLSTEDYILTISAVDGSASAILKSGKSTTFEFLIGEDIKPDSVLYYDHLPLRETATYEFTDGVSFEDKADLRVQYTAGERIFMGNVADETIVNRCVYFADDQTNDADAYLIKAYKDITVTLDVDLVYGTNIIATNGTTNLYVCVERGSSIISATKIGTIMTEYDTAPIGYFRTYDELIAFKPAPQYNTEWAVVNSIVYRAQVITTSGTREWVNTQRTAAQFFRKHITGTYPLSLKQGDCVVIATSASGKNESSGEMYLYSQSFVFSWLAVGEPCNIDMFKPGTVVKALIRKIFPNSEIGKVEISDFDDRLANTMIIAGESARGLSKAKLYTSFNDFCNWMDTVFGYTYYIDKMTPPYNDCLEAGKIVGGQGMLPRYTGDVDTDNICFSTSYGCFCYVESIAGATSKYSSWIGSQSYNDYSGSMPKARKDKMFNITLDDGTKEMVYFDEDSDQPRHLTEKIVFEHRSQLFRTDLPAIEIANADEVKYSIDAQRIYSSVDIGYEKRDYDNINGRDEFNFNIEYSIDCQYSEKKLSMRSKYRADCYGLEFLSLKRNEETTDSDSDKSIFFLRTQGMLPVDLRLEDHTVEGALTDQVYNGEFSPANCVKANAGIIGAQADSVTLAFASSTGNSDIVIDDVPLNDDITIEGHIVSVGTLEFTCDAVTPPADLGQLLAVTNNGMRYTGYISQAEFQFAKTESVKYTLLVKDIEPCS